MTVLIGLALASCVHAPAPESPFAGETVPTAPPPPISTIAAPGLDSQPIRVISQSVYYANLRYDLWAPSLVDTGALPMIVVVPGDSPNGSRGLSPLAERMAGRGTIVMVIEVATPIVGARHPEPLIAVSCALATAHREARRYGADPTNITLVGYDFGASVAMIVGQDPELFLTDCPATEATSSDSSAPDTSQTTTLSPSTTSAPTSSEVTDRDLSGVDASRVVGIAGLYDLSQVGSNDSLQAYFGGTPEEQPGLWASGDPYAYIGLKPEVAIMVIGGGLDTTAPWSIQTAWAEAASEAGHQVELVELADAGHTSLISPDSELDALVANVFRFITTPTG